MGTDVSETVEKLPSHSEIKVHSAMCIELEKIVDSVVQIFPEIEAARPRCASGIQSLCLLNNAIDKARYLIWDCSESSKLYLALNGKTILSRCKKAKNLLEESLSQIQTMVPVMLASKIGQIISDLQGVNLSLDPSEEEAGKAVRALLEVEGYQTGNRSEKVSGSEYIRIAALKLKITSQKALLLERRSIKKLVNQLGEGDYGKQQKKQILLFLSDMLNKYRKLIASTRIETDNIMSHKVDLREEARKDVSREQFERSVLAEHGMQLSTDANVWENSSSSVISLSSMYSLHLPVDYSNLSLGSLDNSRDLDVGSSQEIDDEQPWESRCKYVDDLMARLKQDDRACEFLSSENLVGSLTRFLKAARDLNDVKAQRIGCLLLLILVSKCRCIKYLSEDEYGLIAELLESEVIEEALAIIEELSSHQSCRSEIVSSGALTYIFKILDTQIREIQTPALKILYNLSSARKVHSILVSSYLIPKLVTLSEDDSLLSYCIAILTNLWDNPDNRTTIAETDGCIPFITKVLESESCKDQEQALEILLPLCSQSVRYCRLVMDEGVIPAVVSISVNGNDKGIAKAQEMLRLLRDTEIEENVEESAEPVYDIPKDLNISDAEKKNPSKTSRIFSKFSLISRGSLGQKRKV